MAIELRSVSEDVLTWSPSRPLLPVKLMSPWPGCCVMDRVMGCVCVSVCVINSFAAGEWRPGATRSLPKLRTGAQGTFLRFNYEKRAPSLVS